jgi:predicted porin
MNAMRQCMTAGVLAASATLLALTAPSPAQAVPIFQSDDTRVDLHGRLRLGLVSDDGKTDFTNIGSRFGFRGTHTVDDGFSVFFNTEFRFDGSEVNRDAMQIRNTFFGVSVDGVGRFRAGNFDSLYYDAISSLSDLPENAGFRALNSGGQRARGNTLAFESALGGPVRFGFSAKWQSEGEERDEALSTQAYLGYSQSGLNLAIAFDQANSDFTDGADDALIGIRADYRFTPGLLIGAYYEDQGSTSHVAAAVRYGYGSGNLYATVSRLDPAAADSSNVYTAGVS